MECKKWKRRKRNAQGSRAKRPPSLPFKDWRDWFWAVVVGWFFWVGLRFLLVDFFDFYCWIDWDRFFIRFYRNSTNYFLFFAPFFAPNEQYF